MGWKNNKLLVLKEKTVHKIKEVVYYAFYTADKKKKSRHHVSKVLWTAFILKGGVLNRVTKVCKNMLLGAVVCL